MRYEDFQAYVCTYAHSEGYKPKFEIGDKNIYIAYVGDYKITTNSGSNRIAVMPRVWRGPSKPMMYKDVV